MPIPPPPTTFRCVDCGWHKTVVPRSDVLHEGYDWFNHRPSCGSTNLTKEAAGLLQQLAAKLRGSR